MRRILRVCLLVFSFFVSGFVPSSNTFAQAPWGAAALEIAVDPVDVMLDSLHVFLDRKTTDAAANRASYWNQNFTSPEAYRESIQPNIERFKDVIGWIEPEDSLRALELISNDAKATPIYEDRHLRIVAIRWGVTEGLDGEGLMLIPSGEIRAACVAIPDADQTPGMLAGLQLSEIACHPIAMALAREGIAVIVPSLINRRDDFSGNARINKWTNQPHREFIYRMAFEMGGHIIGMECAKTAAALRWLEQKYADVPLGLVGYGEGGLIALYTGAIEARADAVLVSGYFGPREKLAGEPIYRNVWNLLSEFGDADVAGMIAPRALVIEDAAYPEVVGPPARRDGRGGAAPGILARPSSDAVRAEFDRAKTIYAQLNASDKAVLLSDTATQIAGSPATMDALFKMLGLPPRIPSPDPLLTSAPNFPDDSARQKRQFDQMVAYVQRDLRYSPATRKEYIKSLVLDLDKANPETWNTATAPLREAFYKDVIGKFEDPLLPPNPRMRLKEDAPNYRVWEVMLDVLPDMPAYGWLLEPKNIAPGERRPVVVCQHGLEGRPAETLDPDNHYYRGFARTIADEGYIVFAPQNPYIGEDRFRSLQRKLNPLGKSLFSIITLQHTQIINWLESLPIVDPARIGFYGLSYGGKTAMRVPALETRYCFSICSADFNDWIVKNATYESAYSYIYTGEYEIFEWNLGRTFNYAEMAALIAPRPFMVERGHHDGVAPDEWVASEFAKVRGLYTRLGIADRTEIEFFNGPHQINAKGTMEFLRRNLSPK